MPNIDAADRRWRAQSQLFGAHRTQVAPGLNRFEVDNHFWSICHGNE